ncbi:ABC-type antimicrobial peptide transport system, ATPase component [Idiomarina sp. A28L]|uniref:peptide ABC transporter ATP-binding protein n=1 Tax=Idiomarina sp. A28L TaxID=1036674 RepID=UPI00021387E9|nr:ABC transporter ATP-binding protein [Idiomarina sp. A28L]EGN75705.1 ABC-type antimicrobial peptide transport system, ATPase component [Idiomarina sp. A28L]
MSTLLEVKDITKTYIERTGIFKSRSFHAVKATNFTLEKGKTLAIMGSNGSGKSTLAALISGAATPTSGDVYFAGERLIPGDYQQRSKHIRMVFQDAEASLNPHLTLGKQLEEPLIFNSGLTAGQRRERIIETLQQVGLLGEHMVFYPQMMSTGQKQRASIARAIILKPDVLVADEALATLDSSVRAQIINLLLDLQDKLGIAYIFISQSPEIVKHLADEVLVMHEGEIIERGTVMDVFNNPQQNYTQKLLRSELSNAPTGTGVDTASLEKE